MLRARLVKKVGNFVIDVELSICRREYVVLLGKSGAGKTMIAKMIAGLEEIDSGSVILDGRNITNFPPEKRQICYLPQTNALFPHMTVMENLKFPFKVRGKKPKEREIEEIAEQFGVKELLFRKATAVSSGEAQRVALARAILSKPQVIILDEPLNSLDFFNKLELIKFLQKLKGKTTVIHITHDPLEAERLADRVFYVESGKLPFVGSWKEFLLSSEGELPQKIREFFSHRRDRQQF